MSEERARELEEEVLAAKQAVLVAEQELQRESSAKEQLNIDLQHAHALQLKLEHSAAPAPPQSAPTRQEQKEQKKQLLFKLHEQTCLLNAAKDVVEEARKKLQCCSELQRVTHRTQELEEENSELHDQVREIGVAAKAASEQRSHEISGECTRLSAMLEDEVLRLTQQLSELDSQCMLRRLAIQNLKQTTVNVTSINVVNKPN